MILIRLLVSISTPTATTRTPLTSGTMARSGRARFSSWYEFFPRSCSDDPKRHGTFKDCEKRLQYAAAMGFDPAAEYPDPPFLRAENHLNLADAKARKYLMEQTERHFFGGGADTAQGYVPPAK